MALAYSGGMEQGCLSPALLNSCQWYGYSVLQGGKGRKMTPLYPSKLCMAHMEAERKAQVLRLPLPLTSTPEMSRCLAFLWWCHRNRVDGNDLTLLPSCLTGTWGAWGTWLWGFSNTRWEPFAPVILRTFHRLQPLGLVHSLGSGVSSFENTPLSNSSGNS